jgi:long-subunit fatty acid transport protein
MVRRINHGQNVRLPLDVVTLTLVLGMCLAFVASASAQRIAIAPKPVGSGARALGQSAFIAVADDATAASWNPAGLIQLEQPEASIVGAWKVSTNHYSAAESALEVERGTWDEWELNFLSYAQPLQVGNRDVVLSVNYHQEYDFGLELDYVNGMSPSRPRIQGSSEGALSAYSFACATAIPSYPELTFGAGFNWHTQSFLHGFAWRRHLRSFDTTRGGVETTETFDDVRGCNFTFGLLWDAYKKGERLLTLGFVCHTPYTARMHLEEQSASLDPNGQPLPGGQRNTSRLEMDFPMSLGAGANYRFSDTFNVAADVEWKDWSDFEQRNLDTGKRSSPIGGGDGDIADTLAVRIGVECLTPPNPNTDWVRAIRAGIFYDPRPALDDPMPVYGASVGLGWTLKKRLSLDFAYQYRWGETVNGENLGEGLDPFRYRVEEHFFVASLVTYF